jgi:hypothetical protein
MSRVAPHEAEVAATRAQQMAAQRVKDALAALLKGHRAERMYTGSENAEAKSALGRFRRMYLSGLHEALQEMPQLLIEVTPEGFYVGSVLVLEVSERRGDVAEALFAEGLRAVSIESGATDDELGALAGLLLTPWANNEGEGADLGAAAWEADFSHVFLDVVEVLAERQVEVVGESPIVRELAGLVAELNAQAAASGADEMTRLRQDELAVMLKVRDQVQFDDRGMQSGDIRLAANVSGSLAMEVRDCHADIDMIRADIAGLLGACLESVTDPGHATIVGGALYAYVINAVLAETNSSGLVQRTVELLDRDLTPHLPFREQVRDAAASLAQEPTRGRLSRLFHQVDPASSQGLAFTVFQLLPGEDEAVAIAPALPAWAVRVLADTVLLRAAPEPLVAIDVPRRFLATPERGSILLGLAMAARQHDPRLIEPVLAHATDSADDVREAVLVALRQHQTPRIRERVHAALHDDAESVRLEALRYSVAYRDADVVPLLTTRLTSTALARTSAAEVRALCIAFGRLQGANGQAMLVELAEGARDVHHPDLRRLALHGLKAIGTQSALGALARLERLIPELADEVRSLTKAVP